MLLCPNCNQQLTRNDSPQGLFWLCSHCCGRAVNIAVLRKSVLQEHMRVLWRTVYEKQGEHKRPCPACRKLMLEVSPPPTGHPAIDVCTSCHFFWFDPTEFEGLPMIPPPP